MDFYEFVKNCKENGLTAEEALNEWQEHEEERKRRFMENYYDDPVVQEGWHQQDMIDLRRMR